MDCPDSCGLEVIGRRRKDQRIRGAYDHPVTQGFICDKVVAGSIGASITKIACFIRMRRTDRKAKRGSIAFPGMKRCERDHHLELQSHCATVGGEAILPYHYDGSNGLLSHRVPG